MDWDSEPCDESALLAWLREGGATVHPALTLRPIRPPEASEPQTADLRATAGELGVFAARPIAEGELLFAVPEATFALAVTVEAAVLPGVVGAVAPWLKDML